MKSVRTRAGYRRSKKQEAVWERAEFATATREVNCAENEKKNLHARFHIPGVS